MYTLIGSTTSPYVRKLRMFFIHHHVDCKFSPINYLEEKDAAYLREINPINKIPVLLIQERPLYDSRVIYNYFEKNLNLAPLTREEQNILSAIDGAMDTSINLFSLRRGGLDLTSGNNPFINRQNERVPLILNYLLPWVKTLNEKANCEWNFLTMSLYSYLYWGQFREILSLENFPEMQNFIKKYNETSLAKETQI